MTRLDDAQRQQLRHLLDQRAAELSAEVRAVTAEQNDAPSKTPRNQVEDEGEQSEQSLHETVRHAERERDMLELRDIAAARARMEAGVYGLCVECGTDIPPARLEAQPAAARCISCQEKREQTDPLQPRMRTTL